MSTKLQAYKNDPKLKEALIAPLQAHYDADEIIKGVYWENGKGCAVGCTVYSDDHSLFLDLYDIPLKLAYLDDRILEGLPNKLSKKWPLQFAKAISVGKDLSQIWPRFAIWLLTDPEFGVLQYVDEKRKLIGQEVADTYKKSLTEGVSEEVWRALRIKARAFAVDAAAVAAAVAAAPDVAYVGAAYAFAKAKNFIAQSKKLLELLSN